MKESVNNTFFFSLWTFYKKFCIILLVIEMKALLLTLLTGIFFLIGIFINKLFKSNKKMSKILRYI